LHCAEKGLHKINEPISFNTIKAAAVIGGYFQAHAIFTFGFMGEDPKIEAAKLICEYLRQHKPQAFQGRDILRNKNAFKSMDEILPGLTILIERGYIREMGEPLRGGIGRPKAPTYEVNPRIYGFIDNTDKKV
jgi:replicative DNA helicase